MSDDVLPKSLEEAFDLMRKHSAWLDIEDQLAAAIARAERAEAALAVAGKALQPLAEMAARYDPDDDDGNLECWSGLAVPKIKHVRAARAAMVKITALKGGAE